MKKSLLVVSIFPTLVWGAPPQTLGLFQQQMDSMAREDTTSFNTSQGSQQLDVGEDTVSNTPDIPVQVNEIIFEGNTLIPDHDLQPIVADIKNRSVSLTELQRAAQRITEYYRANGYPLSRAYLPPQSITDGRVTIALVEAQYGRININNSSEVRTTLLDSTAASLHSGAPIQANTLNHSLGLLQNLNGVQVSSAFSAGEEAGQSDLTINVSEGSKWNGQIGMDANGSDSTGRFRLYGQAGINNLIGFGDRLTVYALTTGKGLNYAYVNFETTINGYGSRIAADLSALHYRADGELSATGSKGNAFNANFRLTQPLWISPTGRVNLQLGIGRNQLNSSNIATTDKKHIDSAKAAIDVVFADAHGSTAINTSFTIGHLEFDHPQSALLDAQGRRTAGCFGRINADLSRRQFLPDNSVLNFRLSGQYSPDNLDGAEQFQIGGTSSLRGYGGGSLYGSSGYAASVDWYKPLNIPVTGQWQGNLFADYGAVWVNPKQYGPSSTDNYNSAASVGAGLTWAHQGWSADLTAAVPVGDKPSLLSERDDYRVWFGFKKDF